MAAIMPHSFETVAPSEADAALARESSRALAIHAREAKGGVRLQLIDDGATETVALPASALRLLMHLLVEMSRGNAVTLVPTHAELTTQQAADLLNVSRPYLAKLLDEGRIPGRMVGKYRRVRFDDVLAFKQMDDDARAKTLDQLSADAQELGMGY